MIRHADSYTTAEPFVPPDFRSLRVLREAACGCRGCDLYKNATQTVFGEGGAHAKVVMVGEAPGDSEDRRGSPFVGPAGKLLDTALLEVGIDRDRAYLTNVVKHFKFTLRGKRRIHQKPTAGEIRACRPWLEAEMAALKPPVLVALGATAAQSLFGRDFKVTQRPGEIFESEWAPRSMATIHPSAILRVPDDNERDRAYWALVEDLRTVARFIPRV